MIKIDMSMPECCIKCPFYSGVKNGTCIASNWDDLYFGNTVVDIERHYNCPLKECEEENK